MKLTPRLLKRLIKETIRENRMILSEALGRDYDSLMSNLEGQSPETNSIGILSGQYPMAQAGLAPEEEDARAMQLNQRLSEMGFENVPIDGKYGNEEKSNVVHNPSQEEMERLCEEFQQESYVHGEKQSEGTMVYELRKVIYNNEGEAIGSDMYPETQRVTTIIKDEELAGASDNYSAIGGKKFAFPFFK